ncbi:hypothetical protein U1Q18_046398 [Sarracenia purpurea var. burkii]
MVLKVMIDLQCPCCYKKVKKLLCKFPEIRNQIYDEKQDTVTITVVCWNPEKLRDKLCCKGRKIIKSIEIKEEPEKPPPKEEPKKPPPKEEPQKPPPKEEPKKPPPKEDPPKEPPPCQPPVLGWCLPAYPVCCGQCYHGQPGGPCHCRPVPCPCQPPKEPPKAPPPEKPKEPEKPKPPPEKPKEPEKPKPPPKEEPPKAPPPCQPPVLGWCPPAYPVCCEQCYHGQPGGPCHRRPVPCYDGWDYAYGYGYGHGGH